MMRNWIRPAAYSALALILLVLGAALRPLVIPENQTVASVLNPAEIGFSQDMTAHHEQALIMVQRLDPSAGPAVRRLAAQLDQTQRLELGTMLGWLRLANAAPDSPHPMAWMPMDNPAAHQHSAAPRTMPGMATNAELDALAAARGHDADVLFLQLMLRHHQGGIAMAQAVDGLLSSGPVKELARSMIQQQGQEVGVIGVLLNQLGGHPLP
ncbi:DUF305 domain-containing protein [Nocardia arthritidis]|uniref:DUF305 domain-containing protein n=2 Tax=Nocardia arthritidis TaxID=228602 RepID=A0A6G9YFD4_9NOCA|nr:DUF305 domain-containing protein [Nocardia arthritidis]